MTMSYIASEIETCLRALAPKRPVFHSEADFQHSLAWEMRQGGFDVRLEYRPPVDSRMYVDIWAYQYGMSVAVELKYKTKALRLVQQKDVFDLSGQSAQDQGRYDYLKDVARLERLVSSNHADHGVAILVTNDPIYWKPGGALANDAAFRIHEGRQLSGSLAWSTDAGEGSVRKRETPVLLRGTYQLGWREFVNVDESPNGRFRYLLLSVGGNPPTVVKEVVTAAVVPEMVEQPRQAAGNGQTPVAGRPSRAQVRQAGLSHVFGRLAREGWCVTPTSGGGTGTDATICRPGGGRDCILQVRTLSKRAAVGLGKNPASVVADYMVVCCGMSDAEPTCWILSGAEVRARANPSRDGQHWLEVRDWHVDAFRERWDRLDEAPRS